MLPIIVIRLVNIISKFIDILYSTPVLSPPLPNAKFISSLLRYPNCNGVSIVDRFHAFSEKIWWSNSDIKCSFREALCCTNFPKWNVWTVLLRCQSTWILFHKWICYVTSSFFVTSYTVFHHVSSQIFFCWRWPKIETIQK